MLTWRLPGIAIALVAGTECALAASPIAFCSAACACVCSPAGVRLKAACLAALAFGTFNALVRDRPPYGGPSRFVTLSGIVIDVDRTPAFGSRFTLRSQGRRLEVDSRESAPALGATVRVHGRLDAFDEPRNAGEASPRALAAERGLFARVTRAHISPGGPSVEAFDVTLARVRDWASGAVRSRIREPQATILAGALWGERGALPDDVRADFQTTGTMHVLVTAGLHVGILAALAAAVMRGLRAGRIAGAAFTIAAVWAYAAISGAHLPSQRAATMATFVLLAHASGRRAISWHALCAAAAVIAIVWPGSINSVSFALSFSCVAAIVLFAQPIAAALEARRVPGIAAEAIALTLATQVGTWPLTAATFLIVAPYAPIANAAVVPLTGAALVGGLALLASSPFPHLAGAIAVPEETVLSAVAWTVHAVAGLPGARATVTPPPPWVIAAYDASAVGSAMLIAAGRRRRAAVLLAAACALVFVAPREGGGSLRVTVLDVGQGDAIVIRTPGGHTVLIDTGGRLERNVTRSGDSPAERVGERVVVPFLLRSGVKRIDAIVLTHPHGDHVGGCAPILRSLSVSELIDTNQAYGGFAYRDCRATAAGLQVPVVPPPVGSTVNIDGVALSFLSPEQPYLRDTGDDVNENSIVVMLSYQGRRMLLMGDAGQDTEARLLARGVSLRAGILKVGHHGSAYASSPAFLQAVGARTAIISVGRDNSFGHPAPETIANLHQAGARILRTDLCGAVTVIDLRDIQSLLGCTDVPLDGGGERNGERTTGIRHGDSS